MFQIKQIKYMIIYLILLLVITLTQFGCSSINNHVTSDSVTIASQTDFQSGVVLVKFDSSVQSQQDAEDLIKPYDLELNRYNEPLRIGVVNVPPGEESSFQKQLEADINFEYVELNYESGFLL